MSAECNRTVVLLLFIGSGCAALIYEVIWLQVLQLVIGGSAASLAVLLGAFMGGMSAGSLLLPRYVSPAPHPLRVFAAIEAAIGGWGALLIVVMPLVGRLYTAIDRGGDSSIALRALVSFLLLLPPTMLMGATLPAMSRLVEAAGWRPPGSTSERFVGAAGGAATGRALLPSAARVGRLYGANIFGALIGCVAAGFYLLPWLDLGSASLVAVVLNAAVATAALLLATRAPHVPGTEGAAGLNSPLYAAGPSSHGRSEDPSGAPTGVYAAIALSGFTALGAEVTWTRLLSLSFGATTYTFSLILAVFLVGLGSGSAASAVLVRRGHNPRVLLGGMQVTLAIAIAYGAWMAVHELPYWSVDTTLPPAAALNLQTDLFRALLAVLPAAVLWGASVPLAIAAVVRPGIDAGAVVGSVCAANTSGAIAGAILTPLVFIPAAGTSGTQRMLIVASALAAAAALLPVRASANAGKLEGPGVRRRVAVLVITLLTTSAAIAAATVSPPSAGLVAWGRLLPWHGEPYALYVGEGANASVAVTEESNGRRNFHVSGKVEASTEPQDMRLQRLLANLAALMHQQGPRHVLVVGFGSGVTAGALSIHPSVERMVICEIEPLIPKVVAKYFGDVNDDVATDLKVRIVYEDARHYVLATPETFDVITSDPIHPWVKGAAALYTREFFEHIRNHLNPGGVVTQWVPLYESTEQSVRSVIATFVQVFPGASIWRNDDTHGQGYDAVLVGRTDNAAIDVDAWQSRLERPEYQKVRASLAEVGYESAADLLATYLGRGHDLEPWLQGAEINTDRNLRLQYLAAAGVNTNTGTEIRDSMLRFRRFPDDLFAGDPASVSRLRERLPPAAAP